MFLILASAIAMLAFDKYLIDGYLILTSDNIKIMTKTLKINISINDLTKLKFTYDGFDGDIYLFNPHSILPKDGTGNFIMLQNKKNETYNFELLLNKTDLMELSNIFNNWKKTNSTFMIKGAWWIKT
ncbi:MAG TPA: hypothetical protein PKX92_12410 [Edaphocola sp.]|nr:hypothetical protein [Edaphocola sp.]